MKKLWWLLAFVVVATAAKDVFQHFGPMAEAYRAYRDQAESIARTKKEDSRYRNVEGHITGVDFRLESAEPGSGGEVHLVVVESLVFQKPSEMGPLGNRRVVTTRQRVTMARRSGSWVVAELDEESPQLTELSSLGSD